MNDRTRFWLAGAATFTLLAGCGGTPDGPPPKSIGITNPNPNDPLKDVTLENESGNMDKIRKIDQKNNQDNLKAKTTPVERGVY